MAPIYEGLREAIRSSGNKEVAAGEILSALGPRAFGVGIVLTMAPICLPMPPGVPTVCGVILSMFAIQMIAGLKRPWLPRWARKKSFSSDRLLKAVDEIERRLKFIEHVLRPRWSGLTRSVFMRLYGIVFLVLGVVLILPIPFLGNMPPAIAAAVLGLAIAQRDGLLALVGLAAAVAAVAFSWHMALVAFRLVWRDGAVWGLAP